MFAEITETFPDPAAPTPADLTSSNLRISIVHTPGDFYVVQDFRDKSVLGGLSDLGGLGSLLSTIFAMIFGVSLLQIFYGTWLSDLSISAHVLTKSCRWKADRAFRSCARDSRAALERRMPRSVS